ncbi:leucyl/phenylalanyl-tRNA--protein transferase [Phragmitibacter flavus]|uniref:Leucyl/phenylalanyl-tRNA--protein transferase n=1 Tax=Phragmitibacter flavus TaxID=2576071 RepID=A0A5R8KDJ3_9BACT|nr:leucyl/phenylalanyl-tRNA--protein transferase [Phragmitibacter flavus]TLD69649.1 leucyl/phenylalanyl-tRNA--protein transferase [Phragmitibacter flavus]
MQALEPRLLINAYCNGIFPMGMENGRLTWFSPDPRGIIPVEAFHVPRSVRSELRKKNFEVRVNTSFGEVLRACGKRKETWITPEIIQSYELLHQLGLAHSVETWDDGFLVGGLYGVCVGGAFFGESMFSRVEGGSKAALVWLMQHLQKKGFLLHDTQWTTDHLAMFGGVEIAREEYLRLLTQAVALEVKFAGE